MSRTDPGPRRGRRRRALTHSITARNPAPHSRRGTSPARERRLVVAGKLALDVDQTIGQPYRRVKEEGNLHQPLEQDHPGIAAANVDQFVQQHPRQLARRQGLDQPRRDEHSRPQQSPDRRSRTRA